jgi:ABC-2 type transport system permease protein
MPYIIISMTGFTLGIILIVYSETDKKKRMLCSPVSFQSMNFQILLGTVLVGVVLFLICGVILPIALSSGKFLSDNNLAFYLINVALMILMSISLSFFMSKVIKNTGIVSNVVNVLSLGMSFLCGVFVPLSMLSSTVKTLAKFLPVYWYEVTNELIGYNSSFNHAQWLALGKGYGIQLLFAVALLSAGMLVGKLREREA